jgi:hypothetical protein
LLRQIVMPLAAIALLWPAVMIAVSIGLEVVFGHDVEERFSPFLNIHLMEEASKGSYSPLPDAVFWTCAILVGLLVFGPVAFFAAKQKTQPRFWVAVAPTLLAVAALGLRFHFIWNETYPSSMRVAFVGQLVIYVICALVGLGLGARSVAGDKRARG